MDVVTLGAALNGSKAYTDQVTQSLMGGVHYRGSVSYYSDLPNDAEEGDSYTVKYAGTSGTVADGTEYTWGYDTDTQDFAWISFSKDTYSKAEIDNKLVGSNITLTGYEKGTTAKQDVSPTDNVNQGLGKIEKRVSDNENNILSIYNQNGRTFNLFDFDKYRSVGVAGGTISISNDVITLTKTATSSECVTYYAPSGTYGFPSDAKIYVNAGDEIVFTWDYTAINGQTDDKVGVFADGIATGSNFKIVNAINKSMSFTVPANRTFLTFRLGVQSGSNSAIYSKISIQTKASYDAGFTDYKPYALSNAELTAKEQANENNISSEQAKTAGMSEGGSNYITVGGIRVYVSATAPTGARTGDLWIGG